MVRVRGANVAGLVGLPRRWPGGALAARAAACAACGERVAFRDDEACARLRRQGLGRRARERRFVCVSARTRRTRERVGARVAFTFHARERPLRGATIAPPWHLERLARHL